jgi:hypothetical protein
MTVDGKGTDGSRWPSAAELDTLVAAFVAATLPKPAWTHLAHLAVGTWHVHHYGPAEALARLRAAIRRLNDAHGTPNTDSSGYHETITRAYVELIVDFLAQDGEDSAIADRVQALLASPLAPRDALLAYYSKERLMSVAARREWVPPDFRALRYPLTARED